MEVLDNGECEDGEGVTLNGSQGFLFFSWVMAEFFREQEGENPN